MAADEPSSPLPQRPRKRAPALVRELAVAMELPFILVGAIVIAGGLGYLIDARAHTAPLFTILLGVVGFAAGVREVLRRVSKEEKPNDRE